jgi:hypothetical protein
MTFEYSVMRNFTDKLTCEKLVNRLEDFKKKSLYFSDPQCPSSPSFYGVFNNESIEWLPRIEQAVGKELYPTYTYSRIYQKGEVLAPHIDRVECEYSFTLALKYDKDIWPIYLETSEGAKEIILDVGDILIYKGVENFHWRLTLEGQYHYQAFFHYVDKNGKFSDKKFDGRQQFATTEEVETYLIRKNNVL